MPEQPQTSRRGLPLPWVLRRFLGWSPVTLLTGCSATHITFLDPQGPIAQAQRQHFWFVVAMTMIVVLPVIIQTPWILWRYRYGGKAPYRPHWDMSRWLDVMMWGVPVIVVAILAVVLWQQTHRLDPYRPLDSDKAPLQVQVVGFDWKWLFIYPEQGIATMGQLVLPADRPISFQLTSATVLQTFFIPALGGQIDAMNRMVTKLHLQADHTGRFAGKNMQYNGGGFHHQRFTVRVVDDRQFDDFIAHAHRQGQPLDRQRYEEVLVQQGDTADAARALGLTSYQRGEPIRFAPIPRDLFRGIVDDAPFESAVHNPAPHQQAAMHPVAYQALPPKQQTPPKPALPQDKETSQ